jgi:cell fate (sporulation/competence/biofilm development) regulator YlbF (YheA/YmcA/DUF963 family)
MERRGGVAFCCTKSSGERPIFQNKQRQIQVVGQFASQLSKLPVTSDLEQLQVSAQLEEQVGDLARNEMRLATIASQAR